MLEDHEHLRIRVANYLHDAGFSPMNTGRTERMAMRRDNVYASLAIQYEPAESIVHLTISFTQDKPKRGIFRNGRGSLRIFVDPADIFGLLCWITSSHDELLPHDADLWLSHIVSLCPKTYAVLAIHGGAETLALVASTNPLDSIH